LRRFEKLYLYGHHRFLNAGLIAMLGDKAGTVAQLREAGAQGLGGRRVRSS
jgi:hypothetical protein